MLKLNLIVTPEWVKILCVNLPNNGERSAGLSSDQYGSLFQKGYKGTGPARLSIAILHILHNTNIDEVRKNATFLEGHAIIKDIVENKMCNNDEITEYEVPVTEEMKTIFPFFNANVPVLC